MYSSLKWRVEFINQKNKNLYRNWQTHAIFHNPFAIGGTGTSTNIVNIQTVSVHWVKRIHLGINIMHGKLECGAHARHPLVHCLYCVRSSPECTAYTQTQSWTTVSTALVDAAKNIVGASSILLALRRQHICLHPVRLIILLGGEWTFFVWCRPVPIEKYGTAKLHDLRTNFSWRYGARPHWWFGRLFERISNTVR